MVDEKSWPPEQPTSFTPLLLIHHQGGNHTPKQVETMAKLMYSGDIDKVDLATGEKPGNQEKDHKSLDTSRATKEIKEILAPLEGTKPAFVLIEGAPGIGKSMLLKEIAYKWGNKELLKTFTLVLLVTLRDPSLWKIKNVKELFYPFCKGDENATQIVSGCAQYFFANGGWNLTFLLDGYDEYPDNLKQNSLIADILRRQVLPCCGLVVSSRAHASQHLRTQAIVRVDILGFTEAEREHHIKQALADQPHKIDELTQYLHHRPSVDSICFIPFNMVILLYLYKLGIPLPRNSTELYHHFIYSTICRHLSKFGNPLTHDIADLTNLPEPYNRTIKQLSKLSLEALSSNKLIFTLEEITAACPDIAAIPGAINGFGLLQAVQHFGLYTKTMTLNFIHFTVQEFLAAHYISHLPPNKELEVIKENFWNNIYFNVFSIYITLTKGQRSSFKAFLSDGNKAIAIADKFLKDQLKCLRLYHCFKEADDHTICKTIETAHIFHDREINLSGTALTISDMECISLIFTSSLNKEWKLLNLRSCYIQDIGLNTLYRGLRHSSGIIINTLNLYGNNLTTRSSSLISELVVKCQVKELWLDSNHTVGEGWQLYSMLTNPSSVLKNLYMWDIHLSSRAASDLFTALKQNNKLEKLDISCNPITDDARDAIILALEKNSCLAKLYMHDNQLSNEAIVNIAQCMKRNNTLQCIGLPTLPEDIQQQYQVMSRIIFCSVLK